jgi:hypothetical protein
MPKEALRMGEVARLRFGADMELNAIQGQAYFKAELPLSSARAFEQSARSEPSFYLQASEIYRALGMLTRVSYLNLFLPEEKERVRQRVALATERAQYSWIASLQPLAATLARDDEVSYALAYSLFRSGDFPRALKQLGGAPVSEAMIGKKLELENLIRGCANGPSVLDCRE